MKEDDFQQVLDTIRANVRGALDAKAESDRKPVGLKPFAKANGMGETVVRDLMKAHNKDVQISTLAKIAKGTGVPLSDLIHLGPPPVPSVADLQLALRIVAETTPAGLDAGIAKRPTARAVRSLLQLIAENPSIRTNLDALREAARKEAPQPLQPTPDA